MSIKTPRLIKDRCGVFYFRLIVPLSWREYVKKTEIRRSLRTKDVSIARQAALLLSARMEVYVANSKSSPAGQKQLTPEVDQQVLDWMRADESYKMIVRKYGNGNIEIETDTPEEAKEARAILADHAKLSPLSVEQAIGALPTSRCGTHLEQAKADYELEKKTTLGKSTLLKHAGVLKAFIEFKGNIDVAKVRAQDVADFKRKLLQDGRAATTVNDQMSILNSFFDYCISNKQANMINPAKDLNIVGAHNKAESYEPFKLAELGKILAGPIPQKNEAP